MSALDETVAPPEVLRGRGGMKWNRFDADVLPLWVAESDLGTAPAVMKALREAVEREAFGYPPASHDPALAAAFCNWSRVQRGWAPEERSVFTVPDVMAGVVRSLETFIPEGPIVFPVPSYHPFFDAMDITGRERIEIPMLLEDGRYVLDLDRIEAAFAAGARGLIVCNPYNPLGTVFTRDELARVADLVERHGARVIADEIHGPLDHSAPHVPYAAVSDAAAAHSVTVLSASKTWNLPGLHCALLVTTNPADRETWAAKPSSYTMKGSTLGAIANTAAFRDGEPWRQQLLAHLRGLLGHLADRVAAELPEATFVRPQGTYLAWIDLAAYDLEDPARALLRDARVALSPGAQFGADYRSCVRVNCATSTAILDAALDRIVPVLSERGTR